MTTLSACYIRQPRYTWYCDACGRRISGPYIRLYGMADRESPWTLRLHATGDCCPNISNDPKIARALALAQQITAYRADGWPLCPCCGEDELWSPLIPDPIDNRPPIADYIAAGLHCYKCGWSKQEDTHAAT